MKLPTPGELTARRLHQLIAKGETEHLEFKGRNTSTEDLVASVVHRPAIA